MYKNNNSFNKNDKTSIQNIKDSYKRNFMISQRAKNEVPHTIAIAEQAQPVPHTNAVAEQTQPQSANNDGWVTVNKKSKKMNFVPLTIEKNILPMRRNNNISIPLLSIRETNEFTNVGKQANMKQQSIPEEISKEDQAARELKDELAREKKHLHFLKRQKIKEEKRWHREQVIREMRENKRRDTKVSIISQNSIELMHMKKNVQIYREPLQQNYDSLQEYPSLPGHNQKLRVMNNAQDSVADNSYHPAKTSVPSPNNISSPANKQQTKALSDNRQTESDNISGAYPAKKKVKSKDLINIELMDLIQLKKKADLPKPKSKPQPPAATPSEKSEKRGKVTEGKAKKLTTLKKNKLRHKKWQEEMLMQLNGSGVNNENMVQPDNNELVSTNDQISPNKNEGLDQAVEESKDVSTVSLTPSDYNRIEAQKDLLRDVKNLMDPVHSRKFREYCNHVLTKEIDEVLHAFIAQVVMFHQRLYVQDPIKAKMKKRYYCGLKEAYKHMNVTTCLVMAPNLKPSPGKGCVDELVDKVLKAASEHNVTVVFGLSDRLLNKLTLRKGLVSCISLVNIQGAQDNFEKLKTLVLKAREDYIQLTKAQQQNPTATQEQLTEETTQTLETLNNANAELTSSSEIQVLKS